MKTLFLVSLFTAMVIGLFSLSVFDGGRTKFTPIKLVPIILFSYVLLGFAWVSYPVHHEGPHPEAISNQQLEGITDASSSVVTERVKIWAGLCPKDKVHTVADFKAMMSDPVLAGHFRDFDWSNAWATELPRSEKAIVTHRSGSTILPTKRAINLPAGDRVITDGVMVVRAHCCNDVKLQGIEGPMPGPLPLTAVAPPPGPPALAGPDAPQPEVVSYSGFVPGGGGEEWHHKHPPETVPEPATLVLVGVGVLLMGLLRRRGGTDDHIPSDRMAERQDLLLDSGHPHGDRLLCSDGEGRKSTCK